MEKLTADAIERKLKRAYKKAQKEGRDKIKLENALGVRWYRKLKLFKASNFVFDPIAMHAKSYNWWVFVRVIKGKVVFNDYRYSNSTSKHQSTARSLMRNLGIKIDAEVNISSSLSKEAFTTDSLVPIYEEIINLEIACNRRGAKKDANEWRQKRIKDLKKDVKVLRSLGARFSKNQEADLRKQLLRSEAYRLDDVRSKRESDKELRQEIRQAEKQLMVANEYLVF